MDTPRTSSGKACKLCSKKGSPCHHHSNSPKSFTNSNTKPVRDIDELLGTFYSPGKTPKKISFQDLDHDVIRKLLLEFPREQMVALCKLKNPKIRRICSNKEFQRQYDNLHPKNFIRGKLKFVEQLRLGSFVFMDGNGNELKIGRSGNVISYVNCTLKNFKKPDEDFEIMLAEWGSKITKIVKTPLGDTYPKFANGEISLVLKYINAEFWPHKKNILDKNKGIAFLNQIIEKTKEVGYNFDYSLLINQSKM